MNDLISRKALLAEYDRVHISKPGKVRKLIEDAPRVDAVDLPHWATEQAYKNGYAQGKKDAAVHGRWVTDGLGDGERVCSVCKRYALYTQRYRYDQYLTAYCPNCGAKMDGVNV